MTTLKDTLIAVLMGGPGSEREVSLASGKAVLEVLQASGLNAVGVDVTNHQPELPEGCGLVFNTIHGTFGEDGELQRYLEERGIPCTGADSTASHIAFDKLISKQAFVEAEVPTPASEVIHRDSLPCLPKMGLPCVIKPPCEGSSVGVHIAHTEQEAADALADAAKFGEEILVEAFVSGKELTVGILNDQALPVVHIAPRSGFYDMANKYPWMTGDGGTDYYCPADLSPAATKRVQDAALAAQRALNIDSYSRVDVLLDADENPWVLEINTIPGMTSSSLLPKAAAEAGFDFAQLCQIIAQQALDKAK